MAKKAKVDYDEENDILWIHTGRKIRDSLEIDNFVIDFDNENRIVGVEIFKASSIANNLALTKVTKENLSKIRDATISFFQGKELFYIIVRLFLVSGSQTQEIPIQIPAPLASAI